MKQHNYREVLEMSVKKSSKERLEKDKKELSEKELKKVSGGARFRKKSKLGDPSLPPDPDQIIL